LAVTHRSAEASPAKAQQVREAGFGCHSPLRGGKPRGGAGVARGRFWPALIAPRGQAPRWRRRCTRLVLAVTHRSAGASPAVAWQVHAAGSGLQSPLRGGAGAARGRFWPALTAPRGQAPRRRSRCVRLVLAVTHRSAGASPAVAQQVHAAGSGLQSPLRGGAGAARGRFWPALIAPRGQALRWRSRCTRLVLAFTHRSAVAQALHEAGSGLHSPLRGGKPREGAAGA